MKAWKASRVGSAECTAISSTYYHVTDAQGHNDKDTKIDKIMTT